jgi:hypothetical protein
MPCTKLTAGTARPSQQFPAESRLGIGRQITVLGRFLGADFALKGGFSQLIAEISRQNGLNWHFYRTAGYARVHLHTTTLNKKHPDVRNKRLYSLLVK